jgi:RNA polymerase sigma factor (sigma-70 family)
MDIIRELFGQKEKVPALTKDAFARLPRHVGIIMDGNGRWAKKHSLGVALGHRQGVESLREIIRHTDDLGIGSLSIYACSTENWNRSAEEVGALMQLILDFFASEIDELCEKNVRILILGEKDVFPPRQRETLEAYHFQGLRPAEIARRQGIHRSTVARTLRRAEARLQRFLKY